MSSYIDPLGYLIKRTQQALRHAMDRALTELDLTTPQYVALTELAKEQGVSNAELARRCFVTPQTMHQIVTGLERSGLVTRSQHPEHGRIQQVDLTEEGKTRLEYAHKLVNTIEKEMTRALTKADIKQAGRLLTKCYEALETFAVED